MIDYVFTCDACGLEVEIDDVSISKLAPLPHGWRRINFSYPADKEGEETSLFADHWEEDIGEEICPECYGMMRHLMSGRDLVKQVKEIIGSKLEEDVE